MSIIVSRIKSFVKKKGGERMIKQLAIAAALSAVLWTGGSVIAQTMTDDATMTPTTTTTTAPSPTTGLEVGEGGGTDTRMEQGEGASGTMPSGAPGTGLGGSQ